MKGKHPHKHEHAHEHQHEHAHDHEHDHSAGENQHGHQHSPEDHGSISTNIRITRKSLINTHIESRCAYYGSNRRVFC